MFALIVGILSWRSMRFYDEGEGNAREPWAGSLDLAQHLRSSPALKPDADDKNENRLRGSLSSNGCTIPSSSLQNCFKEEVKFSATVVSRGLKSIRNCHRQWFLPYGSRLISCVIYAKLHVAGRCISHRIWFFHYS